MIQKRSDSHLLFAQRILERYMWQQDRQNMPPVSMRHRKKKAGDSITVSVNQQLVERMIKQYLPKAAEKPSHRIQRQERSRLLSIIEEIGHQDGERKQLEQLIFRRKEEEWKRTLHTQEEQVHVLREEIRKQKTIMETVIKRMEEPLFDRTQLFAEFRRKLEEQLRLERLRAGL